MKRCWRIKTRNDLGAGDFDLIRLMLTMALISLYNIHSGIKDRGIYTGVSSAI